MSTLSELGASSQHIESSREECLKQKFLAANIITLFAEYTISFLHKPEKDSFSGLCMK